MAGIEDARPGHSMRRHGKARAFFLVQAQQGWKKFGGYVSHLTYGRSPSHYDFQDSFLTGIFLQKSAMAPKQQFHILVAVRPHLRQLVLDLLPAAFQPTVCHTFRDAEHELARQRFGLVFCSVQFDKNKLYDLLRCVRTMPDMPRIPFVAGIMDRHRYDSQTVDVAMKSLDLLGVDECIHYCGWQQHGSAQAARRQLQDVLLQLVRAPMPDEDRFDRSQHPALDQAPADRGADSQLS